MIKQKKKYTYEELKKMFDKAVAETVLNPFGDREDEKEQLSFQDKVMLSLSAIPILNTLENKLFGKENINE